MKKGNNPIRYSDIIAPDDALKNLKKQLSECDKALTSIKKTAGELAKALSKLSGVTEKEREETKKTADQAETLAREQEKLKNTHNDLAREIEKVKAAQKEQAKINKLIIKRGEEEVTLNNLREKSYNQLSAQYSLNKIRLNAMSKAERENTEQGRKLVAVTKEIYEEMKNLQEATGKHQLNVGNYPELTEAVSGYGDKVKDALGINNAFGNSLLNIGTSGAGLMGVISMVKTGLSALSKTLFTLMANPVFLAIAGVAGAAAAVKWWFDYNKGLIEATRLTQQFTNKSGNDLKSYRNEVQAIADIYDKDFKEVLIASNALAKQFGISSDEALKLVRDGFVAGADVQGEFLDSLREYPAYFKEAGISAEAFVAIIAESNKAGVFSDKGIDAIKEGNLRIREMTKATADALDAIGISSQQAQKDLQSGAKTTFDIMKEVSAKLNELPESSAVVGTAIADIFGGPGEDAGLQYLKTLKDISTSMDDVKSKTGEYALLQDELLQSEVELNNVISGLFDKTSGGFEKMTIGAKILMNQGIKKLIEGTVDLVNWFIELYNQSKGVRIIFQSVAVVFKTAMDAISAVMTSAVEKWKGFGKIVKGVFTLDFDTFKEGVEQYKRSATDALSDIGTDFVDNVKKAVADLNKKVDPVVIPIATKTEGEKDLQTVMEENKKVIRKAADEQTKMEKDADERIYIEKRLARRRNIADLRKNLSTESDLTAEAKESMSRTLENLENQRIEKMAQEQEATERWKESTSMAMSYAMDAVNQFIEARVKAAEEAVQAADKEVEKAESAVEAEKEARAKGYASNVAQAQKELDMARKNQEKALREQKKAQKAQAAIQTIQQIGDLVTSTALIWSQLGFPFALPAIAVMWGSFAAAKIKAAQMTRKKESYGDGTVELLQGGSHQSGHDIDLGVKSDGTRRRAEGGEFFAVINKRNSRRYRGLIPSVINSLNDGTFVERYMNNEQGLVFNVNKNTDLKSLSDDVREIKEQNKVRMIMAGKKRIIMYKNLKQTINE